MNGTANWDTLHGTNVMGHSPVVITKNYIIL